MKVLTTSETAEKLGCDLQHVYYLIRKRDLIAWKIGRVWRIPTQQKDKKIA